MIETPVEDFSPTQIAKAIGRHQTTVWRAIQRIKLQPHRQTLAGYQYFTAEQIVTIRAAIRSLNKAN